MNGGICVCVLLAALSASCLGRPQSAAPRGEDVPLSSQLDASEAGHRRTVHSTSLSSPLKPYPLPEDETDNRVNLSELLARLISRKGSVRRNSTMNSRGSALNASHRIKDRDYLGWMDFGRRSAEEYEYSS